MGTHQVDAGNIALNLARSQMEYVKSQDYIVYDTSCSAIYGIPYMTIGETPSGFSVNTTVCEVPDVDADILQHVAVTVTSQDGTASVELEGYKTNSGALPSLRDLPYVETTDIPVPILTGADGDCPISLWGEFFAFYGYPYKFEVSRPGALAVTWVVDEDATYSPGGTNRIDVYLYRHGEGGENNGPFDDEFYDNRWDTTCHECSVPSDCYDDCIEAENADDPDPDYPRIVLMDDPDCWEQGDPAQCHDEELPQIVEGSECGEPDSACIAHDEVLYLEDEGNILTTVLTREEGTLSGTVTFTLGSISITGSGTSFSDELEAGNTIKKSDGEEWYTVASIGSDTTLWLTTPSNDDGNDTADATIYRDEIVPAGWYTVFFYNSNPVENLDYLYTVATELASLSFYSAAP
ncbi:MAG: hypothetical protein JRE23_17720 [Deltaproteobacteria bacterium]|nr:hypothetical protein [Deltaproteobacteria bacterium]